MSLMQTQFNIPQTEKTVQKYKKFYIDKFIMEQTIKRRTLIHKCMQYIGMPGRTLIAYGINYYIRCS